MSCTRQFLIPWWRAQYEEYKNEVERKGIQSWKSYCIAVSIIPINDSYREIIMGEDHFIKRYPGYQHEVKCFDTLYLWQNIMIQGINHNVKFDNIRSANIIESKSSIPLNIDIINDIIYRINTYYDAKTLFEQARIILQTSLYGITPIQVQDWINVRQGSTSYLGNKVIVKIDRNMFQLAILSMLMDLFIPIEKSVSKMTISFLKSTLPLPITYNKSPNEAEALSIEIKRRIETREQVNIKSLNEILLRDQLSNVVDKLYQELVTMISQSINKVISNNQLDEKIFRNLPSDPDNLRLIIESVLGVTPEEKRPDLIKAINLILYLTNLGSTLEAKRPDLIKVNDAINYLVNEIQHGRIQYDDIIPVKAVIDDINRINNIIQYISPRQVSPFPDGTLDMLNRYFINGIDYDSISRAKKDILTGLNDDVDIIETNIKNDNIHRV